MDSVKNLPIFKLIDTVLKNRSFEELQTELLQKKYQIGIKEEGELCIIYHNINQNFNYSYCRPTLITDIENSCKSVIMEKNTLKLIATQFNRIIYNNHALKILNQIDWKNVIVQKAYEGIQLVVFNHNSKWHVATKRCIYSDNTIQLNNKSYKQLFEETMEDVFSYDDLNVDYCYYFTLSHHKNRNIISKNIQNNYKKLHHTMTTKKGTLQEIPITINNNMVPIKNIHFENCSEILLRLKNISNEDEKNKQITKEGFVIKVYLGSEFKILKLQTELYQKITRIMPNNDNIHEAYLELYQKNMLNQILPFLTKYNYDVSNRIHVAVQTMAKEILNLYHLTRNKKNQPLYNIVSNQYKKILYKLHGLYMANKKNYHNVKVKSFDDIIKFNKPINKFDVYQYIKTNIKPKELIQLFYDRMKLIETRESLVSNEVKFLDINCLNTKMLCYFMFKDRNQYTSYLA